MEIITREQWPDELRKHAPQESIGERNLGIPYQDDEECVYVKRNGCWYETCQGAINADDWSNNWAWKLKPKISALCEAVLKNKKERL